MTTPRKIALAILATVLVNWGWLAWNLWSGLHPDNDLYLRDTYLLAADTRYVATSLAGSLVPALLVALLASQDRLLQLMLRAGVSLLLIGSLFILVSACFDLFAHFVLKGAYMPRRFGSDPLILAMVGSIWVRLIGIVTAVVGLLVSMIGLLRAPASPAA